MPVVQKFMIALLFSQQGWYVYLQVNAVQEHNALLHKLLCDNMFVGY